MGRWSVLLLACLGMSPGCGENRFQKELKIETAAVTLSRETEVGGYDLITTEELKALIEKKADVVIVDTMPRDESYAKAHVPGAVNFLFPIPDMKKWDPKETGGKSKEDLEKLLGADKSKTIIIYCGFVKCTRSHNGALWAKWLGYTDVKRYPGGIYAWRGAGHPTESD